MEFSSEQQTFIDGLVNKKYTEAYAKAKEKYDLSLAEITINSKSEVDKYKAEAEKTKADYETLKASKGLVDDKAVTERIAAIEGQLKQAREAAAKSKLESIAARMNAISPEQAAYLVRQHLKTDDNGNLLVVNAEGQPRLNAASTPMTEDELFKEFLDSNPHLVKASGSVGAGGTGGTAFNAGAAKTMKRGAYDKMGPAAKMDYIKAGGAITD